MRMQAFLVAWFYIKQYEINQLFSSIINTFMSRLCFLLSITTIDIIIKKMIYIVSIELAKFTGFFQKIEDT